MVHLNLTSVQMLQLMRAAVGEVRAKNLRAEKPVRADAAGKRVALVSGTAISHEGCHAALVRPGSSASKAEILTAWNKSHDGYEELIRECAGLDLDRAIVISPFDPKGRARYSVYAAF